MTLKCPTPSSTEHVDPGIREERARKCEGGSSGGDIAPATMCVGVLSLWTASHKRSP
eukprot:CAMPEP_0174932588 /NCGR_PEP_ID=MMETSP1355-20121228/37234_1 /TAXON_ID=464990 /ORGANISM="Hemiselmis tepida, Strain CCMP443" /LENGTH=56 /DNA_ID=CAMNT_0016179013 /DNA_START=24 /DNA_END=190 /DNA_ORIENTATION=+